MEDNDLLSMDAINWLKSIGYSELNHEQRMIVIDAAKIVYPNHDVPKKVRVKVTKIVTECSEI